MNSNCQLRVVLDVPNVRLFEIQGQGSKFIEEGTLQVLESETLNLTFIKLGKIFQYALQKSIPVLIQLLQNNSTMYILPGLETLFYGVIVPHKQDVSEVFDYILANRITLVQPRQDQQLLFNKSIYAGKKALKEIPQPQQVPQTQLLQNHGIQIINVNLWNHVGQGERKPGLGDYIQKGGSYVREGLIAAAEFIGAGIKMGGDYISSKVDYEEKQIDPSTLNKVKLVNTGTKAMVIFTRAQVDALINLGKMIGEEASKQFADSETGKRMQEHKYYAEAKEIGAGALVACVSIYDGLTEALCVLLKSTGEATTHVVQQKYGNQAGQLSQQGFEVVGNLAELDRMYVQAAAKAVVQGQSQPGEGQVQWQQNQQK